MHIQSFILPFITAATEIFLLSVGDRCAQMGATYASFLRNISIRSKDGKRKKMAFLFAVFTCICNLSYSLQCQVVRTT